jgi:hypothetical protein
MTDAILSSEALLLPELLKDEATGLVSTWLDEGWAIVDAVKLNLKREIQVMRLTLQHKGQEGTQTAILKFFDPELFIPGFVPPDFLEEKVNYQYLQQLRPSFNRFPSIYGSSETMLLMEDLGPDTYVFKSPDSILNALAGTMCNLHTASRDSKSLYESLRLQADLGADIRRYSPEGCARIFRLGCTKLLEFFSFVGLQEKPLLEQFLLQAGDLVLTPGPFWSFVHDDLADRRQSVIIEGTVVLLDFEHGKFFHSLIDLSKLLVGKVEWDHSKNAMIYHHPNIPTELASVYYDHWQQTGNAPSRKVFQKHVDAANIFQTMLLVGRLSELPGTEVFYSMAGTIKMILPRLCYHLKDSKHFSELPVLLHKFCARIMV